MTGAAGYIGTVLVERALAAGWDVVALSRRPAPAWTGRIRFVPYDLAAPLDPAVADGVAAIVHLAADTRIDDAAQALPEDAEVAAAERLIDLAHGQGARIVFLSSQSVGAADETRYSRVKRRIGDRVAAAGGFVVRPGMVYGGPRVGGLFATLCDLVTRSRVIPAIRPAPLVQPMHVVDLCDALLAMAGHAAARPGRYELGDPEPITFDRFLAAIARHRLRRARLFVRIPYGLLARALRLAARLPGLPRVEIGRVEALRRLPRMETASAMAEFGVPVRPLEDGMRPSGSARRRRLGMEAAALHRYVAGRPARLAWIRRYVRAIEALEDGAPLDLPRPLLAWPPLLRLAEPYPAAAPGRPLVRRLDIALALVEATPEGDALFTARSAEGLVRASLAAGAHVLLDAAALLLRPLARLAGLKPDAADVRRA